MAKSQRNSKRIYLVNRDFQMRYVRSAVLVALCSTALTMFLILYPLFYLNVLRFPNFLPKPFLIAAGVAALLNFSMIAWLGIHLSHRIAGPVFAVIRFLRGLAAGEFVGQMRVRESDELKYLIRHLNDLAESLRVRTRDDLERITSIQEAALQGDAERAKLLELCDHMKADLEGRLAEKA